MIERMRIISPVVMAASLPARWSRGGRPVRALRQLSGKRRHVRVLQRGVGEAAEAWSQTNVGPDLQTHTHGAPDGPQIRGRA